MRQTAYFTKEDELLMFKILVGKKKKKKTCPQISQKRWEGERQGPFPGSEVGLYMTSEGRLGGYRPTQKQKI